MCIMMEFPKLTDREWAMYIMFGVGMFAIILQLIFIIVLCHWVRKLRMEFSLIQFPLSSPGPIPGDELYQRQFVQFPRVHTKYRTDKEAV